MASSLTNKNYLSLFHRQLMQMQGCNLNPNDTKKIFLITKLDPKSETWRRVDERVKNALDVNSTSNISHLDYHFTIYNVDFDSRHPDSDVFENPQFVRLVKDAYKQTFCLYPHLHLSSVYGKYELFPKPTQAKPKPFPRSFVRHYELTSDDVDANGVVKKDAQGKKILKNDAQLKLDVITLFRRKFRDAIQTVKKCTQLRCL